MFKNFLLMLFTVLFVVSVLFFLTKEERLSQSKNTVFIQNKSKEEIQSILLEKETFDYSLAFPGNEIIEQGSSIQFKEETSDYLKLKESVGWLGIENAIIRSIKKDGNVLIFDKIYSNGNFGFRQSLNPKGPKHLIVLGGSNAYGVGASDVATFPELLGKQLGHSTYNLGVEAYGPSHSLRLLELLELSKLVSEKEGLMIYYFFPIHMERVFGKLGFLKSTRGLSPKYTLKDNELIYNGMFKETFLYRLSNFLGHSRLFQKIIELFEKVGPSEIKLLSRTFLKIKEEYKKIFPSGNFLIYIPNAYGWEQNPWRNTILEELKDNHLKYFESKISPNNLFLLKDHHISSIGHNAFASELAGHLSSGE